MWLKLSDDFDDDCARVRLSIEACWTHLQGLLYCMRRETGGLLDDRALRRFSDVPDPIGAVNELLAVGFWRYVEDGYEVVHGMEHQPELDVIDARRKADAERQRRKRARAAGLVSQRESRRDTPHDDTRDPGRDGTGLDGTGTSSSKGNEENEAHLATLETIWPNTRLPGSLTGTDH